MLTLIRRPLRLARLRRRAHTRRMTWTVSDGINYECACETINLMIALHTTAIADEESKPSPDATRIARLEANITRLVEERNALSVTDQAALQQVVTRYAPHVRERLGVGKAHAA